MDPLYTRLRAVPAFASWDDATVRALHGSGRARTLKRGQALGRRGEAHDGLHVILAGHVRVVRRSDHDTRGNAVLRTLGADAIVGLASAAEDGALHSADVEAADTTTVFTIPRAALLALVSSRPAVARWLVTRLAALVSALSDDIELLRSASIDERVRHALRTLGSGRREVRVTHEELAARVGAERANVSRALRRLAGTGAIRQRRGRIELLGRI
jgi:CRP/FNR family transcriptional regulator